MLYSAHMDSPENSEVWRVKARAALRADIAPEQITWCGNVQASLIDAIDVETLPPKRLSPLVPARFLKLSAAVLCHRDSGRHALLYSLLWRIIHHEPTLLSIQTDAEVHRAYVLAKAVQRDAHKMKAFVRFREVPGIENSFIAWFEPEHYIVDRVVPFFIRRFAGMRWAIMTPYRSAFWDGSHLMWGPGSLRSAAPLGDSEESLWQTYYANIFNPSRLNPRMMRQEMPQKYWKNLPEAKLLPTLIRTAGARSQAMIERIPTPTPRRR